MDRKLLEIPLLFIVIVLLKNAEADCSKPQISPNVLVNYPTGQARSSQFSERTMLELTCKDGFEQSYGDSVIMCLDSRWKVIDDGNLRLSVPFRCKEKSCPVENPVNGFAELKGKTVLYSCRKGYRLQGTQKAMCRLNKKKNYYVTMKLPKCIKRPQCKLPAIPHLSINGSTFDGETAEFSCPVRYELRGEKTVRCDLEGNWENTLPYCQLIPTCEDPGESKFSNRSGNCCNVGMSLNYTCHEGYEFLNEETGGTITCIASDTWSGSKPICKPIGSAVCPDPSSGKNFVIDFSERSHNEIFLPYDELDLECIEYYTTNYTSLTLSCMEDGSWDSPFPECYPMSPCDRPRIPKNGRIIELEDNDQQVFPIEFEINIECDEGYTVTSGLYGTKCIGERWESEPEDCVPITCSDPGIPSFGMRSGSSFNVKDTVTFSCMSNYKLIGSGERTCEENGRWSGLITVCDDGKSDCIDPGFPLNSYRVGDKFNFGDIVVYSCKSGFTLFGNGTRQCLKNPEDGGKGYWSGEQIECFGKNEFSDREDATNSLDITMTKIARSAASSPMRIDLSRNGINLASESDAGVNMIFLIDVSASINEFHFNRSKEFVKLLITKVGISEDKYGVRVCIIAFSSKAEIIFKLTVSDINLAMRAINGMKLTSEGTNIVEGLNKLVEAISAQTITEPDRANAKSVAFLLSDGRVTEGGTPIERIKFIEANYKVAFHAVAIGAEQNKPLLSNISSHVLMFSNHKELVETVENAIGHKIDFSYCGLDRPNYNIENEVADSKGAKRKNRRKRAVQSNNRVEQSMRTLSRIAGGSKVLRPWPWMAAFQLRPTGDFKRIAQTIKLPKGVVCGGSIIHNDWILTAAHCFTDDENEELDKLLASAQNWMVTAGRTEMSLTSGIEFRISKIYTHPKYNRVTEDYDMALVKTHKTVPFDHFIRPICLPPPMEILNNSNTVLYKAKQSATVAGWGHDTAFSINESVAIKAVSHLNEADVYIQDDEICQKPFNYTKCASRKRCKTFTIEPTEQMMCAADEKADACSGDSGGPLMQHVLAFMGEKLIKRWFVVGIVSWGLGCGQKEFNGYYTHTARLRDFVTNVTKLEFENIKFKEM